MDTFYLNCAHRTKECADTALLRTHTSPMQIRTMEKQKAARARHRPRKVYRREQSDATHSFAFHRSKVSPSTRTLPSGFHRTIEYFVKKFFRPEREKRRYPPSYFHS